MPVCTRTRAGLSRTVTMFASLLLTAVTTSAPAREFRAADTQSEDYPTVQAPRFMDRLIEEKTSGRLQIRVFHSQQLGEEKETIEQTRAGAIDLNRTNVALIGTLVPAMDVTIVSDLDRKPFEAAMAGIYAKARRDPAAAALIERIRKVD